MKDVKIQGSNVIFEFDEVIDKHEMFTQIRRYVEYRLDRMLLEEQKKQDEVLNKLAASGEASKGEDKK